MDTKLTNAEFAVLSLIAEAPRHGYEIEQLIEKRGMRNWTEIGFSSIYFLLKKLEGRGLIAQAGAATRSRRKPKVFRLTQEGERAHNEATWRALAEPEPLYPALLLGLANWPALSPQQAGQALKARETALEERLQDIRERRAAQEPLPAFVGAMFDYSAAMIEAEMGFLSNATSVLKEDSVQKVDFKKEMKALYNPPAGAFQIIDVPPLTYFMVDGKGDPNAAAAYREAVEALYAASYTLKFMAKKELSRDYTVPPLEGLWWAENIETFITREKSKWSWTMMIMVPGFIDRAMAERAVDVAAKKKDLPALPKVRFETLEEGKVVQVMHIGSYDEEGPVLKTLHEEFLPANGLRKRGKHHEIYIGDPRKTAPERLKTVLRQPVEKR